MLERRINRNIHLSLVILKISSYVIRLTVTRFGTITRVNQRNLATEPGTREIIHSSNRLNFPIFDRKTISLSLYARLHNFMFREFSTVTFQTEATIIKPNDWLALFTERDLNEAVFRHYNQLAELMKENCVLNLNSSAAAAAATTRTCSTRSRDPRLIMRRPVLLRESAQPSKSR